jgi:hypothetical protein
VYTQCKAYSKNKKIWQTFLGLVSTRPMIGLQINFLADLIDPYKHK